MTDLTPPPEQPMDDQTRARIRARLTEAASAEPASTHNWLLPIVAAAAVLVIAFGGAYAAFWPSGDSSAPPATQESTAPSEVPSEVPARSPARSRPSRPATRRP